MEVKGLSRGRTEGGRVLVAGALPALKRIFVPSWSPQVKEMRARRTRAGLRFDSPGRYTSAPEGENHVALARKEQEG